MTTPRLLMKRRDALPSLKVIYSKWRNQLQIWKAQKRGQQVSLVRVLHQNAFANLGLLLLKGLEMDENCVIDLDYVCDSDFTSGTFAGQINFSPVSFLDDFRNETKAT